MADSFQEFGFGSGDESVGSGKFERFKPQENVTYRMSCAWWPEGEGGKPDMSEGKSPRFVTANRHYVQGIGYFLAKGPEMARLAGGPAKPTVASIFAIWPTNAKGELSKQRFADGDFDVKPWVFSAQVYEQLKRRHGEWPFTDYDIQVTCTDTQYMKVDIQPARDSLLKKLLLAADNPKAQSTLQQVIDRTRELSANIRNLIAQDLSIEKLKEKMGGGTNMPVSSETSQQVDEMLDDLLK